MVNLVINKDFLGEKLFIFIEFKKGVPSDLRPQDDEENLIIIYLTRNNFICHSEASEESHVFVKFLTRRIIITK
jgi:hypothetical protein